MRAKIILQQRKERKAVVSRLLARGTGGSPIGHAPVEVVEEADQIEAQLVEALFLMMGQRSEDLGRI